MIITAWVVREELAPASEYYAGQSNERKPVFKALSAFTKQYKSERAANAAINIIRSSGYEGHPVVEYIDGIEVADEQPQADKPKAPPSNTDKYQDFDVLLKYGPIRYLRKSQSDDVSVFAMTDRSGNLRTLGDQELFAFRAFIAELTEVGEANIKKRLIAAGKDPECLDDWRDK